MKNLRSLLVLLTLTTAAWSAPASASAPSAAAFQPTWDSLARFQCPEWFRDAKFGIWAHWGPQAVPMAGDWYARKMYESGPGGMYGFHVKTFGHPSQFGYKDIIPQWRAEKFDPDRLMALYQAAGARYFVSMGVHHDNFDLWDSKYQTWNAVRMGPKRDIVAAWQKAARQHGLRFGVSEHLGASYTWFQSAHGADRAGPLAGVPYDGADPRWQDLYHPAARPDDTAWYSTDPAWAAQWYRRVTDLLDRYQPDLLYTDGGVPFGEVGRQLIAHFYNSNLARSGGALDVVYTVKDLRHKPGHGEYHEGIGVHDMERGRLAEIKPQPWQTDTSIGDWFYNKQWRAKDTGRMYRSAKWIIHTLVDVVSKNGNLLLNVVQRPDGSLDPEVETLLGEIGDWMRINGEGIYGTRPWVIYGEGPNRSDPNAARLKVEDFRFSADDIRFTRAKDGTAVYAIVLGWPTNGQVQIKALGSASTSARIQRVELLGHAGPLAAQTTAAGLVVTLPASPVSPLACVLKVTGDNLVPAP